METVSKLFEGVAALLWPLIVLVILLRFRGALEALLQTARTRKIIIKVAGNELTLDEARAQDAQLLAGLQQRITALELRLRDSSTAPKATAETAPAEGPRLIRTVLWVDDNPKNNSVLVDMLFRKGIKVDTATTTRAALDLLANWQYDVVITDMGRYEDNRTVDDAGIKITRAIRERDKDMPVVIFCSAAKARSMRDEALAAGALEITSNGARLLAVLDQLSERT